jgi:hypothetical protein
MTYGLPFRRGRRRREYPKIHPALLASDGNRQGVDRPGRGGRARGPLTNHVRLLLDYIDTICAIPFLVAGTTSLIATVDRWWILFLPLYFTCLFYHVRCAIAEAERFSVDNSCGLENEMNKKRPLGILDRKNLKPL